MKNEKIYWIFTLLVSIIVVNISCTTSSSEEPQVPEPEATYPPLEGTKWTMIAFEPESGEEFEIDSMETWPYLIEFETDSSIDAISSCNTLGAGYTIGEEGVIEVTGWGGTRSKCGWTITFTEIFLSSYLYEVRGDFLYIYYDDAIYAYYYNGNEVNPTEYDWSKRGRAKFRKGLGRFDHYLD